MGPGPVDISLGGGICAATASRTEGKPSEPPTVRLVHHSYQPSKAELEQDHRVDATFKEIAKAVTRTVKVEFYKPPKRSR